MQPVLTCCAVLVPTRRLLKVTSSRSVSPTTTVSAVFSNAVSAKSARLFLNLRARGAVKLLEPPVHLFFSDVFLVRRDGPDVAERIRQRPRTITIKLVLQRLH